MPSLYTHQVIAKKVFDRLDKPNYIKNHFNEFLLGSLGVEIFNYHKLLKMFQNSKLERVGSILKFANHKDFLITLIEDSKGDIKHMVYVLGFITDYAADRSIRPYIHSRTEKPEGGGDVVKQAEFEQALDAYIYRQTEMEDTVAQADFLQNVKRATIRHAAGLLSGVCKQFTFDIRIWRKHIVDAYMDTKAFTQKTKEYKDEAEDRMRLHEGMIGKLGRLTPYVPPKIIQGNDVFNLAHRTWRAPFALHTARVESVTDLIEEAVELSVDIINQVNEYYIDECGIEKVEEMIGNVNFNGREIE